MLVAREREPGVDDDDLVADLVDGHVLADLAEAAERDDPERVAHRPTESTDVRARERLRGDAAGADPSRSRQPRTASRSSSRRLDEREPEAADLVAEQVQRALDRDRVHDDAQEVDRRRELLVERAGTLDVARRGSDAPSPSPAARRRACARRRRRGRRPRGTGRRGRRRPRRGRGRARRSRAPARDRGSPASRPARSESRRAARSPRVSRLRTTRPGML